MPIQQPNHLIPNPEPDVVRPPEPAQPPEPDVIRPPTPEETPEKDIPIGVPDQNPDLPPPEPPRLKKTVAPCAAVLWRLVKSTRPFQGKLH